MAEYRGYIGLDVHKDTIAAAVAWPGEALSFAYEAGPCGYGVYREITETVTTATS